MTTKEETLRRIAIMQAWCDGEKIEYMSYDIGKWELVPTPVWEWDEWDYRIAPKPKRKVMHRGYISKGEGRVFLFCGDEPLDGYLRAPWLDGEAEVDD